MTKMRKTVREFKVATANRLKIVRTETFSEYSSTMKDEDIRKNAKSMAEFIYNASCTPFLSNFVTELIRKINEGEGR